MKRILAMLLALIFASCFMLVSCTDDDKDDNKGDGKDDGKIESESQWNKIFAGELTNYTLETGVYDEMSVAQLTDSKVYYKEVGYIQMYIETMGDSYYAYAKPDSYDRYVWLTSNEAEELYDYAKAQSAIRFGSLVNQYDKFTYDSDKKVYISTEQIQLNVGDNTTINCINISISFKNGALNKFECRYTIDGGECPDEGYLLRVINIGSTSVDIPQDIIDEAKDSSMPS